MTCGVLSAFLLEVYGYESTNELDEIVCEPLCIVEQPIVSHMRAKSLVFSFAIGR